MFHSINNKKRFALGNEELNLIKFNNFFYNNEDIVSFTVIRKKWIIEDADDEFFKKHIFCRLPMTPAINSKISIFHVIKFLLNIFYKKMFNLVFKKLVIIKKQRNNLNLKNLYKIYSTDLIGYNSLNATLLKKNSKSQCINFFFFKKFFKKEFFKQKVQSKNHSFYKTTINVDIFSKKLVNSELSFAINSQKKYYDTNKVHFFLNFIPNTKVFSKKLFNYKITKTNCKVIKKPINITKFFYPLESFINLSTFFQKKSLKSFLNINTTFKKNHEIVYSNFSDKNIQNVYTYNLLKLLNDRNNYLTNEYSNMNINNAFKNFSNNNSLNSLNYLPNFQNKFIMNNFLPYFNFNVKSIFYKNVILRNILNPNFSLYYSYYLFNFLETFLNRKIWLKINTKANSIINPKINTFIQDVFNKNKSDQFSVGRHFYLLEFLEIMYISLYYRDLKFFSYWFKKTMEKLHLKKHRKLIKVVQNTLKNNIEFLNLLNVHGFTMDVRGKLGTTGNSKKKHYAFTVGTMSPTSKNHDMSMNQTTVRTSTGVLGVTITLSY